MNTEAFKWRIFQFSGRHWWASAREKRSNVCIYCIASTKEEAIRRVNERLVFLRDDLIAAFPLPAAHQPAPDIAALVAEAEMMGSWTLSDTNLYPDKVLMMVQDLAAALTAQAAALADEKREHFAAKKRLESKVSELEFAQAQLQQERERAEEECSRVHSTYRAVSVDAFAAVRRLLRLDDKENLQGACERIMSEHDTLTARLAEVGPACMHCSKPASCYGTYEGHTGFSCDECCGHGCEDGHCKPIWEAFDAAITRAEQVERERDEAKFRIGEMGREFVDGYKIMREALEKRKILKHDVPIEQQMITRMWEMEHAAHIAGERAEQAEAALAKLGPVEYERTDDRSHWYKDANPYHGPTGFARNYSTRAIRRVLNGGAV